jgi:hypothetical protein
MNVPYLKQPNNTTMRKLMHDAMFIFGCLLFSTGISGQDRPLFITVTTVHWGQTENFSMDEWKAVEKEYFDKVTAKNEFMVSSLVLLHYFTADNSEIKAVTGYASWEAIEKSAARSIELEKEAWPDKDQRTAFFKKRSAYYTDMHSDEIYVTKPYAKMFSEKPDKPLVYYVRQSHRAFPDDAGEGEMDALMQEYFNVVISKNNHILGYFPLAHGWGSDGRDMLEAFVVGTLGDIETTSDQNEVLVKSNWPDEAKRKEFFSKRDRFFTGWHGDYIYTSVPELTK